MCPLRGTGGGKIRQMKRYDITVPVSNTMPVWPGDPKVRLERKKSIPQGDLCNLTALTMGVHSGTHIDAPLHVIDGGRTVDDMPLEVLVGPCRVIATDADPLIEKKHIEKIPLAGCKRVLFKTRNSDFWKNNVASFREDFVALGLSAADHLAEKGVALVGIDYLSIETYHAEVGNPVHNMLLKNNIMILEGVDLSAVPAGEYELVCLPMKLSGVEGAPVRALLYEKK